MNNDLEECRISIDGCHNSTVFFMVLTPEEVKAILTLAKMSKTVSTNSCMPTLSIEEAKL